MLSDRGSPLLLLRIVSWVHIYDVERALALNLENGAAFRPGEVAHLRGHVGEPAGLEFLALGLVEPFSHSEAKVARDDGHLLGLRVAVGRKLVARGRLDTD